MTSPSTGVHWLQIARQGNIFNCEGTSDTVHTKDLRFEELNLVGSRHISQNISSVGSANGCDIFLQRVTRPIIRNCWLGSAQYAGVRIVNSAKDPLIENNMFTMNGFTAQVANGTLNCYDIHTTGELSRQVIRNNQCLSNADGNIFVDCDDANGTQVIGNLCAPLDDNGDPITFTNTKTFNDTAIDTGTDQISINGHGFSPGDEVQIYSDTGRMFEVNGTEEEWGEAYFVLVVNGNSIQLAQTRGGTAINFSNNGSGSPVYTIRKRLLNFRHNITLMYDVTGTDNETDTAQGVTQCSDNMCLYSTWANLYVQSTSNPPGSTPPETLSPKVLIHDNYLFSGCLATDDHDIGLQTSLWVNNCRSASIQGNFVDAAFAGPDGGGIGCWNYHNIGELHIVGNTIYRCRTQEGNTGMIAIQNNWKHVTIADNFILDPVGIAPLGINIATSGPADGHLDILRNTILYDADATDTVDPNLAFDGIRLASQVAGELNCSGNTIRHVNPPSDLGRAGILVVGASPKGKFENNLVENFERGLWFFSSITGGRLIDQVIVRSCTFRNTDMAGVMASDNGMDQGLIIVENCRFPDTDIVNRLVGTNRILWEGIISGTNVEARASTVPTRGAWSDSDIVWNTLRTDSGIDKWERIGGAWKARFVTNPQWVTKAAAATLTASERLIKTDATSGAGFTITLPTASMVGNGHTIVFKNITVDADVVTIDGSGSETIDGAPIKELRWKNETLIVVSDGSNWVTPIEPTQHTFGPLGSMRIGLPVPGFYIGPASTVPGTIATTALAANTLYASPIAIHQRTTIDQIGTQITTPGPGWKVRLGLYRAGPDGRPGSLIHGSGELNASTAGPATEIFSTITLEPGLYWTAIVTNGTPGVSAITSNITLWGNDAVNDTSHNAGLRRAFTYGILPNPWGSATQFDAAVPNVIVRIPP